MPFEKKGSFPFHARHASKMIIEYIFVYCHRVLRSVQNLGSLRCKKVPKFLTTRFDSSSKLNKSFKKISILLLFVTIQRLKRYKRKREAK